MDLDHFLRDPQSRRRFFRMSGVSVAGACAVLLAACSDDTKNPVKVGPDESDLADVEILNGALDLELMAVAAYKAGAGKLRGERLASSRSSSSRSRSTPTGWRRRSRTPTASPTGPRAAYDFPVLRTEADVLRFAIDLENTAIAAYIDALPKLSQKRPARDGRVDHHQRGRASYRAARRARAATRCRRRS